jgi:hypothetical protein
MKKGDRKPMQTRLCEKILKDEETECWNWLGSLNRSGYPSMGITDNSGRSTTKSGHRVAYEHFVGPIPPGAYVCHRCDNRVCINPAHLFLGTQKDNIKDMVSKGKTMRRNARLSVEAVKSIRQEYAEGVTQQELCVKYSLTAANCSMIVNRKNWKDI